MRKHTRGPWEINDAGPNSGNVVRFEIVSKRNRKVCEIEDPCFERKISASQAVANANLIAAAPELLEVCERLIADRQARGIGESDPDDPMVSILNLALAAIGKVNKESL